MVKTHLFHQGITYLLSDSSEDLSGRTLWTENLPHRGQLTPRELQ
jgi:hypothetical protein